MRQDGAGQRLQKHGGNSPLKLENVHGEREAAVRDCAKQRGVEERGRKQMQLKMRGKADDDGGRGKLWVLRGPYAGAALRFASLFVGWRGRCSWASLSFGQRG